MAETQLQTEQGALAYDEFARLLDKEFRPKTGEAKSAVERAVKTLALQALENATLISEDVIQSIQSIVAELDRSSASRSTR